MQRNKEVRDTLKAIRGDKGITLATLAIYIISMLIALAILATVTAYFHGAFTDAKNNTTDIAEWDKFNVYFLQEVKKTGIDINPIEDNSAIEFVNTDGSIDQTYKFVLNDKAVYLVNDTQNIKIAQNVDSCAFSSDNTSGKTVITVSMTIGKNSRSQDYVLGVGFAGNYDEENNYIASSTPGETAVVTIFTDSNGKKAPIPNGFSVSKAAGENTVDGGLVIKNNNDGNEFVWIPSTLAEFHVASWDYGWDYDNGYKEDLPAEMTDSVNKYGGFYIGRYEISYGSGTDDIDYTDYVALSKPSVDADRIHRSLGCRICAGGVME